ncbi:hypothetical protein SBA4_190027 [Candidatus Sulfopaludibacter sp. SbA4]|nr:hypothetical protein SBA4_190027 [Candidatus Sulfopaludibacter sp. SbA4]
MSVTPRARGVTLSRVLLRVAVVVRAGFEEPLQLLFGDELCSRQLVDELVEVLIGSLPALALGKGLAHAQANGTAEGRFGPREVRFGPGKARFGLACRGGGFRQDFADIVETDFEALEAFFRCHGPATPGTGLALQFSASGLRRLLRVSFVVRADSRLNRDVVESR